MTKKEEEKQHSLEMHLPLIRSLFADKNTKVTIVPVIVGVIDEKLAEQYGKRFANYMDD